MLKACWLTKHRQPEAVDLAARKGGADVMIHLLRMGAVSATERAPHVPYGSFLFKVQQLTPIEIAVRENLPEVVTYLLSRSDVRADVAGATSALHSAARFNHVGCLQVLLAPNSPVNANCLYQNVSPLHSAAGNASLEAVQLLLSRGVVCTVRDRDGSTPLHNVCWCDSGKKAERAQILGLLLESGGDSVMNAQNNDGYTPLHFAVSTKLPQCCKQLLRAGSQASFSIRDENGKTPLEIAFQKRNNCRVVLLRYASSNR